MQLSRTAKAAAAADFAALAFPFSLDSMLPVEERAGKVVIDNNHYMVWRDGNYPQVCSGRRTDHEVCQEQLPDSKVGQGVHAGPVPQAL